LLVAKGLTSEQRARRHRQRDHGLAAARFRELGIESRVGLVATLFRRL
jgi:hypothetical protein